ncbi:hypothetical protein [Methylomonas albis]|uniref:Uncharacterized protein n=1 Tax=Methylomonas albis TaxID=1854563 RepID=A0ABR9D0Y4_9GAMM|nr:hypothetical protein [Methylomonas albis]MBD9356791.1 hypothetical protein [Methylomonas albis]CAD6879945.1 hypothetical protein [Methylomonas albis]
MNPGAIFFDTNFHFHDGESGEKLFVVLGSSKGVSVVAKTTSQSYGKGIAYGCQPDDRFHNFYLPVHSCYLKKNTWICLNEFYELKQSELLQKRFSGVVNHICDLTPQITRELQDCSLLSEDISIRQELVVNLCLVDPHSDKTTPVC